MSVVGVGLVFGVLFELVEEEGEKVELELGLLWCSLMCAVVVVVVVVEMGVIFGALFEFVDEKGALMWLSSSSRGIVVNNWFVEVADD